MRNVHVWNLLALHVPNLLPKTVPWFDFNWHHGFAYSRSHWPRKAGRLIWATILFVIGLVIARVWIKRPKRSAEPATWAQTVLGAMGVWVMMTLGYGVIPSEWIIFGNSYLNFDSASTLLKRGQWGLGGHLPPFQITRDKFTDTVAALIYVIVLTINVAMFVAWQKRKVAEAAPEGEEVPPTPITGGGPFARFRRPKRVSAYGRPVTTGES